MKRAIPILIFILVLILRQDQFVPNLNHLPGNSSVLKYATFEIFTQRSGWIEDTEKGNPKETLSVIQAFQDHEEWFYGEAALRHIKFYCRSHTNLLLMDRPPPAFVT